MKPRERIRHALNHQPTDRVPIDMGSTPMTGIAASTYSRLRRALGLPAAPVKVHEPYQILGLVENDVREKLGIDTIGLDRPCFLMFKEFLSTKDKSKIWPTHFLGRRREYCHMEEVHFLN